MERLSRIAERFSLHVIEDAAEAMGSYFTAGEFAGKHAGSVGDIGIYSFNGNKIVTTGGGGMLVANDDRYTRKVRHLATQAKIDTVYFMHDEIGYNYRLSNVAAAIGLAQFERLEEFVKIKHRNYSEYLRLGIPLLPFRNDIRPNHWFYSYLSFDRDGMIRFLADNDIQSRPLWHLINELPFYEKCKSFMIEKAILYHERIVNIPCSSNLQPDDLRRVAKLMLDFESRSLI